MRVYYTSHKRYFRCHTAFFAPDRCTGTTVSEKVLHREIIKQIRLLYDTYVDADAAAGKITVTNGFQDRINALAVSIQKGEKAKQQLNLRLKNIYIDKVDGLISSDEFLLLKTDFNKEIISIDQSITKMNQEIADLRDRVDHSRSTIDIVRQYKDIQELDFTTVQTLIDYIEIGGSKNDRIIKIHWNL